MKKLIAMLPTGGKTPEELHKVAKKMYSIRTEKNGSIDKASQSSDRPEQPKRILIPFNCSAEEALEAIKKHLLGIG